MKAKILRKILASGLAAVLAASLPASPAFSATSEGRNPGPLPLPKFQNALSARILIFRTQPPALGLAELRQAVFAQPGRPTPARALEKELAGVMIALLSNPDFARLEAGSPASLQLAKQLGRQNTEALQETARQFHSLAAQEAPIRQFLIAARKDIARLDESWGDLGRIAARLERLFSGSGQSPLPAAVDASDFAAPQGRVQAGEAGKEEPAAVPPKAGQVGAGLQPPDENGSSLRGAGSVPAPPTQGETRKKLKAWHKIAISAVLTVLALGITWYFFAGPRITRARPPTSIVFVEKGPFDMQREAASQITRNPDPSNPALEMILQGPGGKVESAAFTDDLKMAVTVHGDGSWRLWDLEKELVFRPNRYPGQAHASAFSSGGKTLILLDRDSTVRIIDLNSNEVRTVAQNAGAVSFHSFGPDGKRLAVTNQAGLVLILDLASTQAEAHKIDGEVLGIGSTSKGTLVLTKLAGKVRLWSLAPGQRAVVLEEWKMVGGRLVSMSLNEDGSAVVVGGVFLGSQGAGYMRVGSSKPKILSAADLELGEAAITGVALDKAGTQAAILVSDGRLWLWNPVEEEFHLLAKTPGGGSVFFSSDGRRLYATDPSGAVRVWSLRP